MYNDRNMLSISYSGPTFFLNLIQLRAITTELELIKVPPPPQTKEIERHESQNVEEINKRSWGNLYVQLCEHANDYKQDTFYSVFYSTH